MTLPSFLYYANIPNNNIQTSKKMSDRINPINNNPNYSGGVVPPQQPVYIFRNDPNTGLYVPVANNLVVPPVRARVIHVVRNPDQ